MAQRIIAARRALGALLLGGIAAAAGGLPAKAAPISFGELTFETGTSQSMWGTGDSAQLADSLFVGVTWNESTRVGGISGSANTVLIPSICAPAFLGGGCTKAVTGDTRTGIAADLETNGRVGLEFGYSLDSGSVDAKISYLPSLTLPGGRIGAGELFDWTSDQQRGSQNELRTNFPELSFYVDGVFQAAAEVDAAACFISQGCARGTSILGSPTEFRQELLGFNTDPDNPNTLTNALGVDLPFNFGESFSLLKIAGTEVANATLNLPSIETVGSLSGDKMVSSGLDDFLDLRIDLDGLMTLSAGLPPLEGSFSAGPARGGFNLIDVEIGPSLRLAQEFALETILMATLRFSEPVLIGGMERMEWTGPWSTLPDFMPLVRGFYEVDMEFFLQSMLNNETFFNLAGFLDLLALSGSLSVEAFGLSKTLASFGPLLDQSFLLGDLNLPPLFGQTFAFDGFSPIVGGRTVTFQVPAPGTLIMALLGLVLLAYAASGSARSREARA